MTPPKEDPLTAALNLPERQDWTVDDLASLPQDLRYELIDGRLILLSPSVLHQNICVRIMNALEVNLPEDVWASIDQSVAVDGDNEPRPDVVLVRESGAGHNPVRIEDVLLAVEVISPTSTIRDRRHKAKKYAYAGIPAHWIVDPLATRITFTEFLLDGGTYHRHLETDELVTIQRPWEVSLDLPTWTARRDRLPKATS
jgi:Uma2 family endonuclease